MKRLTLTIALCLIASVAFAEDPVQLARMNVGTVGGGVPVAASCTTANDTALSTDALMYGDTSANLNVNSTDMRRSTRFVLGAQSTITEYKVLMAKSAASAEFVVRCYLAPNSGGKPDGTNEVADSAVSITVTADDWLPHLTYADRLFTLASPLSGLAADTYHLVCHATTLTSGTVYFAYDASSTGAYMSQSDDAGSTWDGPTANSVMPRCMVYGCND